MIGGIVVLAIGVYLLTRSANTVVRKPRAPQADVNQANAGPPTGGTNPLNNQSGNFSSGVNP